MIAPDIRPLDAGSDSPAAPAPRVVADLLAGCGLPRSEALVLLAHASGLSRERLVAGSKDRLPSIAATAFDALARRRSAGEPVAHLIGAREFYGRRFAVDASVLIPRPETELLVDHALGWIDSRHVAGKRLRVADLGTGSGAVAITLALERPTIAVVASDTSPAALLRARDNASRLGAAIVLLAGDWFDALDGSEPFDLIVSNPPYIAVDDRHLHEGDLRFEPAVALTDGGDGLDAIRRIASGARARLVSTGAAMVEHGHDQAAAVRALFQAAGFVDVTSVRDLAGIERVTSGSAPVATMADDGAARAAL